jgi:hypothetical protein
VGGAGRAGSQENGRRRRKLNVSLNPQDAPDTGRQPRETRPDWCLGMNRKRVGPYYLTTESNFNSDRITQPSLSHA